jgi:hypothetical protein
VTAQKKWYAQCPGQVPSGCAIWSDPSGEDPHQGYNMFRMAQHPNANYITVAWLCSEDLNSAVTRGCGTEAFDPNLNFLGYISVENVHQDNGFDVNGVPVWVGQETSVGNPTDYYSLEVTNLTTLSTTQITSSQLQLPCPYIYSGTPCPTHPFLNAKFDHVSMTGTYGSTPGFALVSTGTQAGENSVNIDVPAVTTLGTAVSSAGVHTVTPGSMASIAVGTQQLIDCGPVSSGCSGYPQAETVTVTAVTSTTFTANFAKTHTSSATVGNLSVGDTGPYAMENIAVKIDVTAASGSAAQIWRLGRVMSIRDADYDAEAHTFVNRNWTAYVWGANWNTDGALANAYYTNLSGLPNFTWTQTISPSGGGTVTGTNCSTGSYASGTTIGGCTAAASTGYSLAGTIWSAVSGSAGCSGSTNPCPSFSITANSAATANFTINSYTVTTSTAGTGSGTVTSCPTGSYTYNSSVSCTATASGGSTFAGWSGTCGLTGTTTPTSFTMGAAACTVIATFNTSGGATAVMQGGTLQGGTIP